MGTAVLVLLGLTVLFFWLRLFLRGQVHYDRVSAQDTSWFLKKPAMEMAYWLLQPIGRALVRLNISPDKVTWASLFFGFTTAIFLAAGHFGFATILATLAMCGDILDGMVARETGVASDHGELLDAVIDRYVEIFFFTGLMVFYQKRLWLQMLCVLALSGSFLMSYSTAKAEALQVPLPSGMRRPERMASLWLGCVLSALSLPFENPQPLAYPMIVALMMITTWSHLSAITRFQATRAQLLTLPVRQQ